LFLLYALLVLWLAAGIERQPTAKAAAMTAEKIAIIIAARNERHMLPQCLAALAAQQFDRPFEVLIADDHSMDGSAEWVHDFVQGRPGWKLITAPAQSPWQSSKKAALQAAIEAAEGEWLVFTDADCRPSVTWLTALAACFDQDTKLVAGFSPQITSGSKLWRQFLLMDSLSAALVAAGSLGRGKGVTGTGRNLAYRRSAWLSVNGFFSLPDSLSGDDDFIIQQLARSGKGRYCLSPQAVVSAQGPADWQEFLRQKLRHLSAGRHYPLPAQLLYGLYHSLNAVVWLGWLLSFFISPLLMLPFLGKLIIDGIAIWSLARVLQQPVTLVGLLIWEPFFILYHLWVAVHRWQQPSAWR